jgi:hypothetical protein
VNTGIDSAVNLQRMLEIMINGILAANAEAASAHEKSMQLVTQRAESGLGAITSAMGAAMATASTLQQQIVRRVL